MKSYQLAHRGWHKEWIENTLEAFREAFKLGFDGVELDVQLTKDGQVVVYHDDDLYRLMGLNDSVNDLLETQFLNSLFKGNHNCRPTNLKSVLHFIQNTPSYVELKIAQNLSQDSNYKRKLLDVVLGQLSGKTLHSNFTLASFDAEIMEMAYKANLGIPLTAIVESAEELICAKEIFYGCSQISIPYNLIDENPFPSQFTWVWNVPSDQIYRLKALGCYLGLIRDD
jgi:glycerophosphoryl diester phosphodiesterase